MIGNFINYLKPLFIKLAILLVGAIADTKLAAKRYKLRIMISLYSIWKYFIYDNVNINKNGMTINIINININNTYVSKTNDLTPQLIYYLRYLEDRSSLNSFNIVKFLDFAKVPHEKAELNLKIIWLKKDSSNDINIFLMTINIKDNVYKYKVGDIMHDVMFRKIKFKEKYSKRLE